jgi:hypothetical protein
VGGGGVSSFFDCVGFCSVHSNDLSCASLQPIGAVACIFLSSSASLIPFIKFRNTPKVSCYNINVMNVGSKSVQWLVVGHAEAFAE